MARTPEKIIVRARGEATKKDVWDRLGWQRVSDADMIVTHNRTTGAYYVLKHRDRGPGTIHPRELPDDCIRVDLEDRRSTQRARIGQIRGINT